MDTDAGADADAGAAVKYMCMLRGCGGGDPAHQLYFMFFTTVGDDNFNAKYP